MQPFIKNAEKEMSSLIKLYTQMKSEFSKAAQFFGEDSSKLQLDEFFSIFATFMNDFDVRLFCMYIYCTYTVLILHVYVHTESAVKY